MFEVEKVKKDFPFLQQKIHGKPVVFLDSGASAQKPACVINAIADSYTNNYANVHRGVYTLSDQATEKYEATRKKVQAFIHAEHLEEVIFTKGTTEAINLVAFSLLENYFNEGDEIIITEMEHHANIVPWQLIAKQKKLTLKYIPVTDDGDLDLEKLSKLVSDRTKMLALTHCSNVLGTINPVKEIIDQVKAKYNLAVLIDGAQSVVHQRIDVAALNCDFYVFSSHKLYGPTGVGVLYAKKKWHDVMTPYQGGGDMIKEVSMHEATFADAPYKFEAGTPDIVGVIGLSKAIEYIEKLGFASIQSHEKVLLDYATQRLSQIKGLRIIGQSESKAAIITFIIEGFHANDLGMLLDLSGVCVRTGHHCAQPLLKRFNVPSTVRASFGVYNTLEDIDLLVKGLEKAMKMLS
ncbi:aminotransferase class V-fold PLP-dependent enzyme [Fangia hongkongensis]|uniref:aminotransferase class V-fold PLP-dependent enzyme n=1 Tax=Fangia hongkongensis TaxID=270495 RepID=UPI0003711161|nr:cysteine desulfurase [Fangia hongkongensis]MBK2123696.1 cysteine desulfurase [Fangia hongkongensis]